MSRAFHPRTLALLSRRAVCVQRLDGLARLRILDVSANRVDRVQGLEHLTRYAPDLSLDTGGAALRVEERLRLERRDGLQRTSDLARTEKNVPTMLFWAPLERSKCY